MAKTSGGVLAANWVLSLSQYASQSDTSTFTLMPGLAASKSETICFQTASSSGAPQALKVMVTGSVLPVPAGLAPPQAESSRIVTIATENINFFIFFLL